MVPVTGAEGAAGTEFMLVFRVEEDVQPTELVTVKE
jgi:hypothetical protein